MRAQVLPWLGLALLLVPAVSGQVWKEGDSDLHAKLYLKATTATSDPHLAPDASSSATPSYTAFSATEGVTQTAGWAQGTKGAAASFSTKEPVGTQQWLNLTKYIWVYLWFKPNAGGAANVPVGDKIRVEVYAGERLAGRGVYYTYAQAVSPSDWTIAYFYVWPEVDSILPNEKVVLKVYRDAGAGDFLISTNGNRASYLEYGFFNRDPLAGALYVDHGKLVVSDSGTDGGEGSVVLPLAGLPLVGLLALSRRSARPLVLLLLVSGAFAGCLGTKAGPAGSGSNSISEGPQNTVDLHVERNETLQKQGVGEVQGFVRDGDKAFGPVRDATVLFVGTSLSTRTDALGRYEFLNLTAKKYLMRVDAVGLKAEEREVVVEVGVRLTLNFTLFSGIEKASNDKAHVHDLWPEGVKEMEFFQADSPTPQASTDTSATGKQIGMPFSTVWGPAVPVPEGKIVLPGTVRIEVKLQWNAEPGRPVKELGLVVRYPGATQDRTYGPRASQEPFNIAIFPNLADSGHQKFTRWTFSIVYPPTTNNGGTFYEPAYVAAGVHVTARIFKGVVPYEPAHEDYWKGAKELPYLNVLGRGSWSLTGTSKPISATGRWPDSNFFVPDAGKMIAPGTKEIRGNFTVSYTGSTPPAGTPGTTWKLVYLPANVNPLYGNWKTVTLTATGTAGKYSFIIPVAKGESDQFYQTASYWRFSPDTPDDDPLAPNAQFSLNPPAAGPRFGIDAKAYCCADYEE